MRILCLLLALLMTQTVASPTATQSNPTSSIDYVINHFEDFIEEYNKLDIEDCKATHIEYQTEIFVNDTQETGYYVDFNGDNGFCIVTEDAVIDMYVKGDYPQMREAHEYMYDVMDGFLVKDGNQYVPFLSPALPELDESALVQGAEKTVYITNAADYIKKAYGSSYELCSDDTQYLPAFKYWLQTDLSVYLQKKNGKRYSEGNCALTSIYTTLSYLQKTGVYPKLPTGNTTINTSKDRVASAAKKNGYTPRASTVTLPSLYVKIRDIAISKYGYTTGGVATADVDNLVQDTLKAYGYNVSPKSSYWLATGNQQIITTPIESTIKTNISKGYPVILTTSRVYGDVHSIVVIGYTYYRRTWNLGFTKLYQYAKLLRVADNHNSQATFFDYSSYMLSTNYVYFK